MRIIDGDGHVLEDVEGIAKHLPFPSGPRSVFPPLDHLHGQGHRTPPGSFQRAGAKEWVEFMDDLEIEQAVLYPTSGLACGQITVVDWAITATRAYNDWLANAFLSPTPRLKGMALLPMQDTEAAVAELDRAVKELGMCGAMLPSTGLRHHLGSREYWPVYEAADRLGCAIALHGGCHNNLGLDDMNAFAPVHALGHPFGLTIGFAGMVFNGVFDRFPNVRFGFLEGGVGWVPFALERFDRSASTFFDYNPSGELLTLPEGERVSEYVARHMRAGRIFIGGEGTEANLPHLVRMVGCAPVLFASDFPHEVNRDYCRSEIEELIDHEELTREDKEAILHGNAERFYGLGRAA